jgi:hypothetical protein
MAAPLVVMGANLMCTFGVAPSTLIVTSNVTVLAESKPIATIADCAPITNIPPFGMCSAPTNPAVIAATAAKAGVFTPAPCVPATTPWAPGVPTLLIGDKPAVNATCQCICAWAGVITPTNPGTIKTLG